MPEPIIEAHVTNADEIEYEMTIRMNLQQWKDIRVAIHSDTHIACSRLDETITEMVDQADKHFSQPIKSGN